jgi:hypothetical protein
LEKSISYERPLAQAYIRGNKRQILAFANLTGIPGVNLAFNLN